MKVILCGYNWIGCSVLEQLLNARHEVFVYTHETPYYIPSVANMCKKYNIPYSFDNISKASLPFTPDIICSIYYRYIIKPHIINACNKKIFNLHPALLPHYRGCSSLTWALINGEKEVGYTYHYIDEHCDTGNIIIQKKIPLTTYDTQSTIYNRVMFEAAADFYKAFEKVINNDSGQKQAQGGTYYPRGCPYAGQIDESWSDEKIERFIRAMFFPPYPMAHYKGQEIKTFDEYLNIIERNRENNQ